MKFKFLTVFTFLFSVIFFNTNAQTFNWKSIDSTKNIISVSVGLDHSLSYNLSYGYKLNSRIPVVLSSIVSIPSGEKLFDDFKIKMGGQICFFNKSNFLGSLTVFGIYRKYQTDFVRIQNFGSDFKATLGYYKSKWFTAVDIGFDKAIVSHFKHTQKYRDEVYVDIRDGWYGPSVGGNFYFGLQGGINFKKNELTLGLGKLVSQDFITPPTIPIYFNLGYNYKL